MFKPNTMQDERTYQRTSTLAARSSYLATDVAQKYRTTTVTGRRST
jgi:hypothetical protein